MSVYINPFTYKHPFLLSFLNSLLDTIQYFVGIGFTVQVRWLFYSIEGLAFLRIF